MNVSVVIVTYGNRFEFLRRVVEALLKLKIYKIFVVDNKSEEANREHLRNYEKKLHDKLKVIYRSENSGSAGGYRAGLMEFYNDNNTDFIWLLDDDNLPEENSLDVLVEFWDNLKIQEKDLCVALVSYRTGRNIYMKAAFEKDPDLVVGPRNTFMGFSLNPLKFLKRIVSSGEIDISDTPISSGEVSAAYYGGLFFHKDLLKKIGYPDTAYYVYTDDTEYSNRIIRSGGKLIVVFNSRVNDIEEGWKLKSVTFLKLPVVDKSSEDRLYYSVRNRIYFEKKYWVTNKFIYNINKFIYLLMINLMFCLDKRITSGKLIKTAIKDGLTENMGKRKK